MTGGLVSSSRSHRAKQENPLSPSWTSLQHRAAYGSKMRTRTLYPAIGGAQRADSAAYLQLKHQKNAHRYLTHQNTTFGQLRSADGTRFLSFQPTARHGHEYGTRPGYRA